MKRRALAVVLPAFVVGGALMVFVPRDPAPHTLVRSTRLVAAHELFTSRGLGSHSFVDRSRDDGPFLRGENPSLTEAFELAEFPLFRPHHPVANDGNIRNVFFSAERDERNRPWSHIAIDYESGLLILLLPAWVDHLGSDLTQYYRVRAAGSPAVAYAQVMAITGTPALVIDRSPVSHAFLDTVVEGVRIEMFAEYAPLRSSDLIAAAETINRPSRSAKPGLDDDLGEPEAVLQRPGLL